MTATHDPVDFVCGDDWKVSGTLNDLDGSPVPLSGAEVIWTLVSLSRAKVAQLKLSTKGIVIQNLATADVLATLPAAITAAIPPGIYVDYIQVILANGGGQYTEWSGPVRVAAAPPP